MKFKHKIFEIKGEKFSHQKRIQNPFKHLRSWT